MNVGEFGIIFPFFTGFNMANFAKLTITFTRPDETTLIVTSPQVTLGAVPLTVTINGQSQTFAPDEYVLYTFQNGDVNQDGLWSARVTYDDNTPLHLISAPGPFTINP